MRRIKTDIETTNWMKPHRVIQRDGLANEWSPELSYLVISRNSTDIDFVRQIFKKGVRNLGWISDHPDIVDGDIIAPTKALSGHLVLYREADMHHGFQITNRCNSWCLMCSQPPTKSDDQWMIEEVLDTVKAIRKMPNVIGLSGGEPLLEPRGLKEIIRQINLKSSETHIEVLTNGRLLSKPEIEETIFDRKISNVSWLVPLYGHADFLHDYIVQSYGAFEETIKGLLVLQKNGQPIQLRIVLTKPVLENLLPLCHFIGKNLPFVREVAIIGCEPIGFALANRDICELRIEDWSETILSAVNEIERHNLTSILMNIPLCLLPRRLWQYAHRSISDWKNSYADECSDCLERESCSGLFSWHEKGWKPGKLIPIMEEK